MERPGPEPGSFESGEGGSTRAAAWCQRSSRLAPRPPRRAEEGEEVAVEAVVAGDLPAEDQPDREGEHDRVRRGRAGQEERHVHEASEEGRDAGQRAEHEPDADCHLTEGDEPREPDLVVALQEEVEEVAIPVERDRALAGIGVDRNGALPVAGERRAAIEPACTGWLGPA